MSGAPDDCCLVAASRSGSASLPVRSKSYSDRHVIWPAQSPECSSPVNGFFRRSRAVDGAEKARLSLARSHVCAGSGPGGVGEAMDLEQAITRLANACVELETAALQRSAFHSRRAERIKRENAALHRDQREAGRRGWTGRSRACAWFSAAKPMGLVSVTLNGRPYDIACDDGQEGHVAIWPTSSTARVTALAETVGQVGESPAAAAGRAAGGRRAGRGTQQARPDRQGRRGRRRSPGAFTASGLERRGARRDDQRPRAADRGDCREAEVA